MNAKRKYVLLSTAILLALLLTGCLGGQPAEIDWEAVNTAIAQTAQPAGPALVNADGWHLVGYSLNPAGTNYQSTAPEGSCWPTSLIPLNYGEKAEWDFSTCTWKKATMNIVSSTAMPEPTAQVAAPAVQQPTGPCTNGEETGNNLNKIDRTPVSDKAYSTVQETSNKPGPGTGYRAYYRWISVVGPLGTDRQVFIKNVETIHEVRYCGSVAEVQAYLMNPDTHIWAMRATAADSAGNMPAIGDTPVVYVDPVNMTVTFLVAGTTPNAPTLEYIMAHIEIVDLNP